MSLQSNPLIAVNNFKSSCFPVYLHCDPSIRRLQNIQFPYCREDRPDIPDDSPDDRLRTGDEHPLLSFPQSYCQISVPVLQVPQQETRGHCGQIPDRIK